MNGVRKNIKRCSCTTKVRLPLPPVIFCVEKDVGASDAYTHNYQAKQHQDGKHEAIDIVDLVVAPNCRQNEVHLDEEAPKGHNSWLAYACLTMRERQRVEIASCILLTPATIVMMGVNAQCFVGMGLQSASQALAHSTHMLISGYSLPVDLPA